jgi:predicted transcriptional regulator of viral defense system
MALTAERAEQLDEAAVTALASLPPIFSYGQARDAGLSHRRVYWLRDHGLIEPLMHGCYRRADNPLEVDPDLYEIATRAANGTICLTSALARHQLTDAIPCQIDIAIPRGQRRPTTAAPVSWHAFSTDTFNTGRDTLQLAGGASIGLYNAERSIIDAFRLRHREGPELAYEALRRWLQRRDRSPAELMRMARHFPKAEPGLLRALEVLL